MLIFRTAFKNIISGGKRTWLNVAVLSFVLVIMVAYNGIVDGWVEEARIETQEWETGAGQFWHPEYDRYDVFTLQDAHGKIPEELQPYLNSLVTPVLVLQASIYPQGRMQNVLLKGISKEQAILKIPAHLLKKRDENDIPAIIGERMSKSADLKEGDRVMLRWRDKNGVFDAREIVIVGIFKNKTSTVDAGQIWIGIDDLYEMTGMDNEATYFVKSEDFPIQNDIEKWKYKDLQFLMADLDAMEQGSLVESVVIFIILLAIALLAVFDTQMLSIFRRQKEIGTYIALGMTPKRVVKLFTLEGTAYSILAVIAGLIWGTPVLYLFGIYGLKIPEAFGDIGMPIGDAIYPVYHFSSILTSILVVIVLSALISYLPARKIAKQNVILALKGKVQ